MALTKRQIRELIRQEWLNEGGSGGITPPPPTPTPLGTIFDIDTSNLANLDDFTINIDGTTSVVLDGGVIKVSGVPANPLFDLDNYIRFDNYTTGLENYKLSMDFVIKTHSTGSEGTIFGFMNDDTTINPRSDWYIFFRDSNSSADGEGYRYFNGTTTLTPNTFVSNPLTDSVNPVIDDEYRMTLERTSSGSDAVFTLTIENLSTPESNSGALTYDYSNTAGQLDMSSSKFFIGHTGGESWFSNFKLESTDLKNVDYLVVGDSMTAGYCSTLLSDRWLDEVVAANPLLTFTKSAGQGDKPSTAVSKNTEFTLINPSKAILFIGTNEVISDGAATALSSYATMYSNLQAIGVTEFIHINALPRGGASSINSFNSGLVSAYPSDIIIDANTEMNDGSDFLDAIYDCGDGIHPNELAQTWISDEINLVV